MMSDPPFPESAEELRIAIEAEDPLAAESCLEEISSSDSALAVTRLDSEDQLSLLSMLPAESAAQLLEELPDSESAEIVKHLPSEDAAGILDAVRSDAQADILGRLAETDAEAILDKMSPADAEDARRLLQFDPQTAGGLMVSEYLRYESSGNVDGVFEDLRINAERYRAYDVQYAYVSSSDNRLIGVLRLRDMLFADRDAPITDLMIQEPLKVAVNEQLHKLSAFFDRNDFLGVPVVDADQRLVGVLRQSDVREAVVESADRTLLKLTGIPGGEELRTMPIRIRSTRRLSWLSINIVLNIVAASVIAMYQECHRSVHYWRKHAVS